MFGIEFWASFIIVWTVQGKGLNTSIEHGLAEVSTMILQMCLYALYHRSTRLLLHGDIFCRQSRYLAVDYGHNEPYK